MSLRILAPTRYPWLFNGPRYSANRVDRRGFVPVNRLWKRFEAVTVFNPLPLQGFDLIHAFNRIPIEPLPFIIGFESHLPRAYGLEHTGYFQKVSQLLAGPRCRRIIAISEHARRTFRAVHRQSGLLDRLEPKLGVRYPNIDIPDIPDQMAGEAIEPFIITFVGNHFGRKGGCVAVRLAQIALERGLNLQVNIVSTLEAGASVWTDPLRPGFFEPYFELLNLPNVRHRSGLPNDAVQRLLRRSHLSLLTTFSDTFGYSIIESMANWTPVLATRQSAVPEFINAGENGLLLDLETNELGDWVHSGMAGRGEPGFEAIYAGEIERLAQASVQAVTDLIRDPARLAAMRKAARAKSVTLFDSRKANVYWDRLYRLVAEGQEGWPKDDD
ncbi:MULTISPECIES: glycosyltransferase [Rhodomicrobium]|uniref:glycosyltransferase n=1 Tax=Rhodomicrobium TaxID=1068 RepID=UPI000B4B7135|nr:MULTISPECIES: glycosyltransferase [Rhodomicrobium]